MSVCSIEKCENNYYSSGFCKRHYDKNRRNGDPLFERDLQKNKPCKAPGCVNNAKSRGYCNTHYAKIMRTGTLKRLVYGKEWVKNSTDARRTELSRIDETKSNDGRRGYLAVNVVNDIRQKAVKRGKSWKLSPVDAYKLIIGECAYCGYKPNWPKERNGIDRINNALGYSVKNSVSCCFSCNSAKGTRSIAHFRKWIRRLHKRL